MGFSPLSVWASLQDRTGLGLARMPFAVQKLYMLTGGWPNRCEPQITCGMVPGLKLWANRASPYFVLSSREEGHGAASSTL